MGVFFCLGCRGLRKDDDEVFGGGGFGGFGGLVAKRSRELEFPWEPIGC